jgi:hypothetical protein
VPAHLIGSYRRIVTPFSSSASSNSSPSPTISADVPTISSIIANLTGVLNRTIVDELSHLTSSADINYTFINLWDMNSEYVPGKNTEGNLILADSDVSSFLFFATDDEVVLGAGGEQLFFYYPAEM